MVRPILVVCCLAAVGLGCSDNIASRYEAAPACADDEAEVASCTGHANCREVSICGTTISCIPATPCDGVPTCASGETAVPSCDGRLACRSVTLCGETTYCQTNGCDQPPTCVNDLVEVSSCAGLSICSTVSRCGVTLSCAPNTGGPCTTVYDCPSDTFCDFADDLCGTGQSTGTCQVREPSCPDSPPVCYCGGITYPGVEHDLCAGKDGYDFSANDGCLGAGDIGCGHLICDNSEYDYCLKSPGASEHADEVTCLVYPGSCADDPITCACLASVIADCGGTCSDGFNGPTVFCPAAAL